MGALDISRFVEAHKHSYLNFRTHPFCHPKVNAFCYAGTRSVKVETLFFVTSQYYVPILKIAFSPIFNQK